jgi:glycosyltransferase involved in cell wall biosynthesis
VPRGRPEILSRAGLPGGLYHKYFEFFGKINIMRGAMLKTHESGGHITTVSGNLESTWGYAAELRESQVQVLAKAWAQKGCQPNEIFLPNRGLDLFEKLPILGITNGMRDGNRADRLPELRAGMLRQLQAQRGQTPLFSNATVQQEMLSQDHNFDAQRLELKQKLRRLLYLEAFHHEPFGYPVLLTAIGRLVEQKNFGLIAEIIPRVLDYDNQAKFIILASPQENDGQGKGLERRFFSLAQHYSGRVYYHNGFNQALAKLILAGGDFTLIPSRFEPCGLVDYEAALLANIPIARATGGLPKIRNCGYLYDWLDIRDPQGEANAFFNKIKEALETYRNNYPRHVELMRNALATNASWDASAGLYLDLFRYGLLVKHWRAERVKFARTFAESLGEDRAVFNRFFLPKYGLQGDDYDCQLKNVL